MADSKHISVICAAVTFLTTLLLAAFIGGGAFGVLTPVSYEDASESEMFTENDLNGQWDTDRATRIRLLGDHAEVVGNGAYYLNDEVEIVRPGAYVVSGSLTNGSIAVNAARRDKVWILLDGCDIRRERGAAIRIEQANKVFLTLAADSWNSVSCKEAPTEENPSADGAIYSRDDLTINGVGSLRVSANAGHGIVCNDDLVIADCGLEITAERDGLHAHESVRLTGMRLNISAGSDGVSVSNGQGTGFIFMRDGSLSVSGCYEGLEAAEVTVEGGALDIVPRDDGINAPSRKGVIRLKGGNVTIRNSGGRDADGLDSNADIFLEGGTVMVSVPNDGSSNAIDYGRENSGVCRIDGGNVVACGSAGMLESVSEQSEQCVIMHYPGFPQAGASYAAVKKTDGTLVLEWASIPNPFSAVIFSSPALREGETFLVVIDGMETEVAIESRVTVSGERNGFGSGDPGGSGGSGGPGGPGGPGNSVNMGVTAENNFWNTSHMSPWSPNSEEYNSNAGAATNPLSAKISGTLSNFLSPNAFYRGNTVLFPNVDLLTNQVSDNQTGEPPPMPPDGQMGGPPSAPPDGQMGGPPSMPPDGQMGGPPPMPPDGQMGGPPPMPPDGHMGGPPPMPPDGQMGGPPPMPPDGPMGGPPPMPPDAWNADVVTIAEGPQAVTPEQWRDVGITVFILAAGIIFTSLYQVDESEGFQSKRRP